MTVKLAGSRQPEVRHLRIVESAQQEDITMLHKRVAAERAVQVDLQHLGPHCAHCVLLADLPHVSLGPAQIALLDITSCMLGCCIL